MALNGLPEGWSYEGPDRSVGLFGESFCHEDCTLPSDQWEPAEAVYGNETVTLTCKCGTVIVLEDPEPDFEPDDHTDYYFPGV